jgi:hypothetical protein
MQWKAPELKVRHLTKSGLRCVRGKKQAFSKVSSTSRVFAIGLLGGLYSILTGVLGT